MNDQDKTDRLLSKQGSRRSAFLFFQGAAEPPENPFQGEAPSAPSRSSGNCCGIACSSGIASVVWNCSLICSPMFCTLLFVTRAATISKQEMTTMTPATKKTKRRVFFSTAISSKACTRARIEASGPQALPKDAVSTQAGQFLSLSAIQEPARPAFRPTGRDLCG